MVRPLHPPPGRVRAPAGCTLQPFDRACLGQLASVQHAAYAGTVDVRVFPELLATVGLCRAHLESLLHHRQPLEFSTRASLMLMEDGVARGFIMAATGPLNTASVDNLAVEPDRRGGAGRALLLECLRRLHALGARSVSLTVTCANVSALQLYRQAGFMECVRLPIRAGATDPP